MTTDDPLKTASEGIALIGEVIKAAGDNPNVREAGSELGRTALTITRTINNALLPIAAINFAFDKARAYFAENFQRDLAEKAATIPPELVVEPKASIAGPALQGLAFSHEEPDLKELYLNLLSSAMDGRTAQRAHPAFVEIIRQLNAEEAKLIRGLLQSPNPIAIAEVRIATVGEDGWNTILRHLLNLRNSETKEPVENSGIPAMVDNWIRLGLATVDYMSALIAPDSYNWVEGRPEFIRLRTTHENETKKLSFEKGVLERTTLGKQFATVVGILPKGEA